MATLQFTPRSVVGGALLLICFLSATSCKLEEALPAVDAALQSLQQNKTLAEQFVRDVKSNIAPNDPTYQEIMEDYEEARSAYHHYLDTLESAVTTNRASRSLAQSAEEAQNAAADFLASATKSLQPSAATRRIPFKRAIAVPDDFPSRLRALPSSSRRDLIEEFDAGVRWRSWRQL